MDVLNTVINAGMIVMSVGAIVVILGSLVKLIINQF